MTMKKTTLVLLICASLFSCKQKKDVPDVSGIRADVSVERFDQAFFSIDTNDVAAGLRKLQQQFPAFYPDFMQQLLGVSGSDTSRKTLEVTGYFLRNYRIIYDSLQARYKSTDWLKKELEQGYRYVKYYFPQYKPGKAILYVGPLDAPGVANTAAGLAIGLQQFGGKDFFAYQSAEVQEMFPAYITRRFSREYMTANCMKAVVEDMFPDQSGGKSLVDQMIEKGKLWYLLDKFMPLTPDSVKTGYTQHQLDWCKEFEGQIWSYIIKNEDLHSLTPLVIQTYIGEAPFTQGLSQEDSPGNIGQWIGWQIIKKFVSKNPGLTPEEVMKTDSKKILEEAKYKPK